MVCSLAWKHLSGHKTRRIRPIQTLQTPMTSWMQDAKFVKVESESSNKAKDFSHRQPWLKTKMGQLTTRLVQVTKAKGSIKP